MDFVPSVNGFHFRNYWPPGTPALTFDVAGVGRVTLGDAGNGLCGGMCFAAADVYLAGRLPIDAAAAPGAGRWSPSSPGGCSRAGTSRAAC